jgi:hypothetical protein
MGFQDGGSRHGEWLYLTFRAEEWCVEGEMYAQLWSGGGMVRKWGRQEGQRLRIGIEGRHDLTKIQ